MPGYKTFSLMLWKQAVETLGKYPNLSAYELSNMLECTEKTAEGIATDYRKLFKKKKKNLKAA